MVMSDFADRTPGFNSFHPLAADISTPGPRGGSARGVIASTASIRPEPLRRRFLLRGRGAQAGDGASGARPWPKALLRRLNLMDAEYRFGEPSDVVFFRNVMIYFDQPTKRR